MQDFFGQELSEGDIVAVTPHGYKTLVLGTVVDFTPKMVRVSYLRQRTWRHDPELDTVLRDPKDLVKSPHKVNIND